MNSRIKGKESSEADFHNLGVSASLEYVMRHTEKGDEVVPAGWKTFAKLVGEGVHHWAAAELPLKWGTRTPDRYKDVQKFSRRLTVVAWAGWFKHLKDLAETHQLSQSRKHRRPWQLLLEE